MSFGVVEVLFIVVAVGIPLAAIAAILRGSRKSRPESFAETHGFELTSGNQPVVEAYLSRSFKWRLRGAVLGAVIPFGTDTPGIEMISGYLIGALLAELTDGRLRREDGEAVASLSPRSLRDYLSPRVMNAMRVVSVLGLCLAGASFAVPDVRLDDYEITRLPFIVGGAAVALVALGVEAAVRFIVRRSQPAAASDIVAADDAIRASSIHVAVGSGMSVVLLLTATMSFVLSAVVEAPQLRWVLVAVTLTSLVAAFATWARFGRDIRWRVERSATIAGAAS